HSRLWLSITGFRPVITCPCPVITEHLPRKGGLLCLLTIILPVGSGTLLWMTSSVLFSEAPTHRPPVKHSQHTINPLITPHVNPFLLSAISTVSVLF
ncbi:unnamed protein product, partial [Staurois parvus]